jgi:hypothetical protein
VTKETQLDSQHSCEYFTPAYAYPLLPQNEMHDSSIITVPTSVGSTVQRARIDAISVAILGAPASMEVAGHGKASLLQRPVKISTISRYCCSNEKELEVKAVGAIEGSG